MVGDHPVLFQKALVLLKCCCVELERVSFIKVNFEINDKKNSSLVTDKAAY